MRKGRKIRVTRWLSKNIGEYDIDNDYWISVEAQIDYQFFAFSRSVYLSNQDMVVLGGLDDRIPNKPSFSNQALLIREIPVNSYDNIYVPTQLAVMNSKRGCFSTIYHEDLIYVFGGLNYAEKVMKKCERYHIKNDQWQEIAPMIAPRKNSTACAMTADTIYVFGGTSLVSNVDTIEKYSIATNDWQEVKVKLPFPMSFQVSFKLSRSRIMLLGGNVKEKIKQGRVYKTNRVFIFDCQRTDIITAENLEKDIISIYPAFYSDNTIYLVDEDPDAENPTVIKYDISTYLPHSKIQ